MNHSVIYIAKNKNILNKAVDNRFWEAGIEVLSLSDDIDEIHRHRRDGDIFLFNAEDDNTQNFRLVKYLTDLCRDEHKSLCVIGNESFVAGLSELKEVVRTYVSPVDLPTLTADITALSAMHTEFRRRKQILIVDDDDDFLMIIKLWLKNAYAVTGVNSGSEALARIQRERFDLILLDYEMPDMDGYEVMGEIHNNPATANIPIIFLTGLNDRETVMRIIKHRPDGYILKSMKKLELLDTLERFFAESILGKR